jgi:hypothetical protein
MDAVMNCRAARYGSMAPGCDDTTQWLHRQAWKLLPPNYFMVTFTLPAELRAVTARHQKALYNLLMDSAHSTLKTFAGNHRELDSGIGRTAVLHSHTCRRVHHPQVHIIVPAVTVNRQSRQCT